MKNYYYLIWADAILSFRRYHPDNSNWKVGVFFLQTSMNALNLWIILLWLKYFNIDIVPDFRLYIFPGTKLNSLLEFAIQFASPCMLLNYFLILYKNRYEKIIAKYGQEETRYAGNYSMIILFLSGISMGLYGVLT